jgi:TP901 family phage tail tape measure protein
MADTSKTIEILFKGTETVGSTIKTIGSKLDNLSSAVKKTTQPFANLADSILKVDAALAAIVAAGLGVSVKKFADLEDVMLKVKGVMGASESEYQTLTDLVKELGAKTRYTADEVASGLEFLALAGLSVDDAIGALPNTLNLAQAAAIDLGEAADIVTNIMAGYGIGVEGLVGATDTLTATFTNSNTSLSELGDAFKFVGPVAKSLGLELDETASILGVLANAGYKAQMGGTALRNILIALVAPSTNMSKLMDKLGVDTSEFGIDLGSARNALDSLGVSVKDADGNLRPFADIMDDMKSGLEKIHDPTDRAATLIDIFGKRGGPQMQALLEQGSTAVSDLERKIESLGGITQDIATEMESGMGGAIRALVSATDAMFIEVGEAMSEGAMSAVGGVTEIFKTIVDEIDKGTFDEVLKIVDDFGFSIGDALAEIAENLPEAFEKVDFSGLADAMADVRDTISGIFDGIDISDPEDLANVIQKIVNTTESFIIVSDGMISALIDAVKWVIDLADNFNDLSDEEKRAAGEALGVSKIINSLSGLVGGVSDAIKGLGASIAFLAGTNLIKILTGAAAFINPVVGITLGVVALAGGVAIAVDKILGLIYGEVPPVDHTIPFKVDVGYGDNTIFDPKTGEIRDQEGNLILKLDSKDVDEKLPSEKKIDVIATADLTGDLEKLGVLVTGEENKIEVDADVTPATKTIEYWHDGEWKTIEVPVETKKDDIEQAKKDVKSLSDIAKIEIEADLEHARIQSDAAKEMFRIKADVDIAEIEAATARIETLSQTTADMFADTGDTISSMVDALIGADSINERFAVERQIRKEQEYREQLLEMQKQLNDATIAEIEARKQAIERGDALIKVNGDGLAPHLEMIMYELLEQIQIRASEEGVNLLLGL